jgi:hypothetical protein
MHLLGNCILIFGLAAFVIIGFLSVAIDLLSRDVFDASSWSNDERALEIAEDTRLSGSANNADWRSHFGGHPG